MLAVAGFLLQQVYRLAARGVQKRADQLALVTEKAPELRLPP
jgi:hypothetical protein